MRSSSSGHVSSMPQQRAELSQLQYAWLSEIGLDRRLLLRYRSTPASADVPHSTAVAQNDMPVKESLRAANALGPHQALAALKQGRSVRRAQPEPTDSQTPGNDVAARVQTRLGDLPDNLQGLLAHAQGCSACGLQAQRDQLVFGAGDTDQPRWLIVGEAPGKADDRTGQPFQGKAGKLLHAMLVAAGVHPASLMLGGQQQPTPAWSQATTMYFTNLNKCRPLANRSPTASEASACTPYLTQQIELLQPGRILALGRLAAQAILQVDDDVEQLRGTVHQLTTATGAKIPVVVTWHPAALLMHPQNKAQAWADLRLAKQLEA